MALIYDLRIPENQTTYDLSHVIFNCIEKLKMHQWQKMNSETFVARLYENTSNITLLCYLARDGNTFKMKEEVDGSKEFAARLTFTGFKENSKKRQRLEVKVDSLLGGYVVRAVRLMTTKECCEQINK